MFFTLPDLFTDPTVRELARKIRFDIETIQQTEPLSLLTSEDRARLPVDIEDAYPLIELQAGMLFHAAYSAETSVYHDVFGCRVGAALEEDTLRAALATVAARHAALRTRFALSGYSRPLQLVEQETTIPLLCTICVIRTKRLRRRAWPSSWTKRSSAPLTGTVRR